MTTKQCLKTLRDLYLSQKCKNHYRELYNKFGDYSRISEDVFVTNLELITSVPKTGDVVECGVWRGGMTAAIAEVLGSNRNYFLFDSFEGLPEARPVDGERAITWMKENKIDACRTEESHATEAMKKAGVSNAKIVKGWFENTLPDYQFPNEIALLRLDADWYSSTADCLNHLYDKVMVGGMIVFDDYFAWDGCSKALHDFLSANSLEDRIRTISDSLCYLIKTREISSVKINSNPDKK